MLELFYKFFKKNWDADKFEEFKMNTDCLHSALTVENVDDGTLPNKRDKCNALPSRYYLMSFTANAPDSFFPGISCNTHNKHDKREPGRFMVEFICPELFCLCIKMYFCVVMIERLKSTNSAAKV